MSASSFRPYKVSALYRVHQDLGARWTEIDLWRVSDSFVEPTEEAEQVTQNVGLQDVSFLLKWDVQGREAEELLTGFPLKKRVTVLRRRPDRFLIVATPAQRGELTETLQKDVSQSKGCVHLTDLTSALSALSLVGPRAREVLAKLTPLDLGPRSFPDGSCAETGLAKIHAVIYREDWQSLPAYVLLVSRELGQYGWDVIRTAGRTVGLVPFGAAAANLLRRRG